MLLPMNPAQWMGPAFPAFLAPSGATPFDTDLAELGCQRPTAFALGKDRVGGVSARAVYDKFLASVRARAPAQKGPFDVEAPSLTRNRGPIDAHASKRHFPFVRGGRLAVSLDRGTVTRFAPGAAGLGAYEFGPRRSGRTVWALADVDGAPSSRRRRGARRVLSRVTRILNLL